MSDDKTEDKKTPPKPFVRLFEGQLKRDEFARTVYCVTAPVEATPEDYLEAETYAHVIGAGLGKVRAGDRLEITAEDKTWWAEVLILDVAGQRVSAVMLRKHSFMPMIGKEHDAFDVEWAGPSAKWRVMRKSDRTVMADKLATKSEAVAWVEAQGSPLKQAA